MHMHACIACLALEFSSSLSLSLSTATAGWMCENRGQSISRSLENQCARAGHGPWTSVARATLLEARHLHPRGPPRKLQCRLLPAPVRSGRPARSTRERASAKKRCCRALSKQAKAFTQAGASERGLDSVFRALLQFFVHVLLQEAQLARSLARAQVACQGTAWRRPWPRTLEPRLPEPETRPGRVLIDARPGSLLSGTISGSATMSLTHSLAAFVSNRTARPTLNGWCCAASTDRRRNPRRSRASA